MRLSGFWLLCIIMTAMTPWEAFATYSKGKKAKGKKGTKSGKGKRKKLEISGSYCATWKTLIAADDEVTKSEGCYVFETMEEDPDLFIYKQCWFRTSNPVEKFKDVAGGVITRRTDYEISWIGAEVDEPMQDPTQAVIGTETGYMNDEEFVFSGAQPGLGLAFKKVLYKVDPSSLDEDACKL